VFLDIDDTLIEVNGHQKQGSGYGYSGVRGINAFLTTVKTDASAPIIVGQGLRRGACGSPRGAACMVRDALATIKRLNGVRSARVLLRADSAFYGYAALNTAINTGAAVSVTARMNTPMLSTTRPRKRGSARRKSRRAIESSTKQASKQPTGRIT
jgi:hypothetical protein